MKALVIGSGLIGERHANNLAVHFQADVSVLSRNKSNFRSEYLNASNRVHKVCIDSLSSTEWDVCVIATPSSIRTEALNKLDDHEIKSLYVEVPVATTKENWLKLRSTAEKHRAHIHAGYNMRYHKSWKYIYQLSIKSNFRSINSIFAEHLPSLHTWEDYKTRYEAVRELGGGPLLTSHHELDMAINLLGRVKKVSCYENNTSLDIDSPDHVLVTLIHESGSLSTIDLNFFYPKYTRATHIATDDDVILVEPFGRGIVAKDLNKDVDDYDFNSTYIESMSHAINRQRSNYCIDMEGLDHLMDVTDLCIASSSNEAIIKCI